MTATKPWYADWTQYFCPGPRRRFTPAEMARGGTDPFPLGIGRYIGVNALVMVVAFSLALQRGGLAPQLFGALVVVITSCIALAFARSLWARPTRLRLNLGGFGLMVGVGILAGIGGSLLEKFTGIPPRVSGAIAGIAALNSAMVAVGWYFLVIYRVQQIEARLRERDAQEARESLQRRLATAQIHPHFVFNTLASLTHWVETGDARAAPLLKEFNAYLRATLPMFEREQQSLREELDLVRHYLAIMQARMGERLQWSVDADAGLLDLALPPGSLLTLVENAITHGIEPSLRGGRITLRAQQGDAGVLLTVLDDGQGLEPGHVDGLGLTNTRERLAALHPRASLRIESPRVPDQATAGCLAIVHIPQ